MLVNMAVWHTTERGGISGICVSMLEVYSTALRLLFLYSLLALFLEVTCGVARRGEEVSAALTVAGRRAAPWQKSQMLSF